MPAATTARRHGTAQTRSTPIGTGPLHHALEDARDLACLHGFCQTHQCAAADVSSDGKRLDILRVFDLMRRRGYSVTQPTRPQTQLRKGFTAWLVDVALPAGPSFTLGLYTPNTS
jgi:hypothetical protein